MFITTVEGIVEPAREADLQDAWNDVVQAGLPAGLLESFLVRSDENRWRIVTIWESREAVITMRAQGRPAAVVMFETAGARPEASLWDVASHVARA